MSKKSPSKEIVYKRVEKFDARANAGWVRQTLPNPDNQVLAWSVPASTNLISTITSASEELHIYGLHFGCDSTNAVFAVLNGTATLGIINLGNAYEKTVIMTPDSPFGIVAASSILLVQEMSTTTASSTITVTIISDKRPAFGYLETT